MGHAPRVSWAVRSRPLPGELVCGDRHLVAERAGSVWAAAIDGLGHGVPAAAAAEAAVETLAASRGSELGGLFAEVHQTVARTRGVAMSMAQLGADGGLCWAGVGNVEAVVMGATGRPGRLLSENGIVGQRLPPLRPQRLKLAPGDILLLVTDGISEDFLEGLVPGEPAAMAEQILARHARPTDDALALVVRFWGAAA